MRRRLIYCLLGLSLAASAAPAAALVRSSDVQLAAVHSDRNKRHKHVHRAAGHRVLLGARKLGSVVGKLRAGRAAAFPFADRRAGTVSSITVYVAAGSRAKKLIAGIYSNKHGRPGSRLAFGSVLMRKDRSWRRVRVRSARVKRGRTYWLAVLGSGGALHFRARRGGRCHGDGSNRRHLTRLPRSWRSGSGRRACRISAYAMGTAATTRTRGRGRKGKGNGNNGKGNGNNGRGPSPSGRPPPAGAPPTPVPPGPLQSSRCFARPGACGYPDPSSIYPASSYVGPVNGTTSVPCSSLTAASGTITLATPGETYSGVNLTGNIVVSAANVTINNVCVSYNGAGTTGTSAVRFNASGGTIENSVVAGANSTNQSVQIALGENVNSGYSLIANHDYLYNCSECVHNDGWTLENSYVISNGHPCGGGYSGSTCLGGEDHYEDVYCDTGTENIAHDTLLNPNNQTAVVFCNTNGGTSSGPCANQLTVTNSLLAGGGFIIYACSNASSPGTSTLTFTGNHIARCLATPITFHPGSGGFTCGAIDLLGADSHGYWPYGGYFRWDAYTNCPPTPGVIWSGNVWDDNLQSIACA
jgi:hypothetical protein